MNTTTHQSLPRQASHAPAAAAASVPPAPRLYIAGWLRRLANRLDPHEQPHLDVLPPWRAATLLDASCQPWFDRLPEATRRRLPGGPANMARLQALLQSQPVPPGAGAFALFLARVPNWASLHRKFAAALLRRVVECDTAGIELDATFDEVKRWLDERNSDMTFVPWRFADALRAARQGCGIDLAALGRGPGSSADQQHRRIPSGGSVTRLR